MTYAGHAPAFLRRFVMVATVALFLYGLALGISGIPRADVERQPLAVSGSAFANATRAVQNADRQVHVASRSESLAPTAGVLDFEPWELPFYRAHLQELLDFDEEDLVKNRAGNASFYQYPFGELASALAFGGGFALFGLLGLREAWSPWKPKYRIGRVKPPDTLRQRIFIGFFAASSLALGLGLLYYYRGVFQDAAVMRVCHVSGPLAFHTSSWKGQTTTWHFTINGTKVNLPRSTSEGSELIRKGATYRLHYLCHSGVLVSIEPFVPIENAKGLPL